MAKEWVVRDGDMMRAEKFSSTVWIPYTKNSPTGKMPLYFSQFLTKNGTGTLQTNMTGDFLSGSVISIIPAAGEILRIESLKVSLSTTHTMSLELYGNLSALGTGVLIRLMDGDGTVLALTDPSLAIKNNSEYAVYASDVTNREWGLEKNLAVKWDFSDSGTVLRIDGDSSERLEVLLQDDFSGLISHRFRVTGYIETTLT